MNGINTHSTMTNQERCYLHGLSLNAPLYPKRVRWLTKEEATTLIKSMPDSFRHVVVFALVTGLRLSNIINLEWSQVDMQRKVAGIHPEEAKAGKAIGVALNDTACKVLRDQIGRHSRFVFVHTEACKRDGGKAKVSIRKLRVDDNSAWNTGKRHAGITDFRFHDLSHTWASWLVQAGVPLSALQEMGGWEKASKWFNATLTSPLLT